MRACVVCRRLVLVVTATAATLGPERGPQGTPRRPSAPIATAQPIRIDGRLDEEIYKATPAITDFVQQEPDEFKPATEKTEAWIFFDNDNVYISARNWESHPERRVANEMRRDTSQLRQNDSFGVLFDTFHDKRNGYIFYANAIGGLADSQVTDEGPPNADWNTVWDVRTGDFDGGWTIEMAIPFKSLRYQPGHRSGVGRQPAAGRAMEERMVVPRAGAARADDVSRPVEGVVGRQPRRPAGAVGRPQPRS